MWSGIEWDASKADTKGDGPYLLMCDLEGVAETRLVEDTSPRVPGACGLQEAGRSRLKRVRGKST